MSSNLRDFRGEVLKAGDSVVAISTSFNMLSYEGVVVCGYICRDFTRCEFDIHVTKRFNGFPVKEKDVSDENTIFKGVPYFQLVKVTES